MNPSKMRIIAIVIAQTVLTGMAMPQAVLADTSIKFAKPNFADETVYRPDSQSDDADLGWHALTTCDGCRVR